MVRERGQVVPLVALLVVVTGAACLILGRLGGAAVARAQAVTAADAAALAGAAAGRPAAKEAAAANGGRLTAYRELGSDSQVTVELGGARATARARRTRASAPGTLGAGLAAGLRAALARAEQLVGGPIPVVRYRTDDPAATRHRSGLALDVPAWLVPRLAPVAESAGLCRPHPEAHPVHFEVCPYRLP